MFMNQIVSHVKGPKYVFEHGFKSCNPKYELQVLKQRLKTYIFDPKHDLIFVRTCFWIPENMVSYMAPQYQAQFCLVACIQNTVIG